MEIDSPIHLSTKKDALQYWMDVAKEMHHRKDEIERELQEYQESSQSLERELESSYQQSDKKNRALSQQNFQLSKDYEQLKNRLNEKIKENSTLEHQIEEVKNYNEYLLNYVRNLEKKNDDLERTSRETKASEEDLETKLNVIIEKVALLETELDEKEGLKIAVQRLKEENRDLQQQITVNKQRQQHQQSDPQKAGPVCGLCRFNAIRRKTCRHTIGSGDGADAPGTISISNKRKSMVTTADEQQPQDDCNASRNSSLLMYVRELEDKVNSLEKSQSCTNWIVPRANPLTDDKIGCDYDTHVDRLVLLEQLFFKHQKHGHPIMVDQEMSDPPPVSIEPEVRLRSTPPLRRAMNKLRPHSAKLIEEIRRPVSTPNNNRASRFEERFRKVKDEEKRQQSLASFLKRLRYDWRRKKN